MPEENNENEQYMKINRNNKRVEIFRNFHFENWEWQEKKIQWSAY